MARTPAYWTNKKFRPSVQAVSQLSLSQAPHDFGAPYRDFPAFLSPSNCLKTTKLRRLPGRDLVSSTFRKKLVVNTAKIILNKIPAYGIFHSYNLSTSVEPKYKKFRSTPLDNKKSHLCIQYAKPPGLDLV